MRPAGRRPPPSRPAGHHAAQPSQLALLKLADLVEEHAEELVALESQNTGKPLGLTAEEEIPPMVEPDPVLRRCRRVLEGTATAEYLEGHTSWIVGSRWACAPRSPRGTTR